MFSSPNFAGALDSRDEILRKVLACLPSLTVFRVDGIYLPVSDSDNFVRHVPWTGPPELAIELDVLEGVDGALTGHSADWTWANSMSSAGGHQGYIVASAEIEPEMSDRVLLDAVAQQTAAALALSQQSALLRAANSERVRFGARLQESVSELSRRTKAHEDLNAAAIHGDTSELARVAAALTLRPVAIVDEFGYPTSSADGHTPDAWSQVRMLEPRHLTAAAEEARPTRFSHLVVTAAGAANNVLGGVVLLDNDRSSGDFEAYVLKRAAALLTGELAHRRALAEVEMRLGREFVVELVEGMDANEACARAATLGHDLHLPHQVAAIRCDSNIEQVWIDNALRSVSLPNTVRPLLARHRGLLLAIMPVGMAAQQLHQALKRVRADAPSAIGMGDVAYGPADLPRSHTQALKALRVRERSPEPDGGTNFSELGLYQILEDRERGGALTSFVRRWLGGLIDYDNARRAQLVTTLARFLDCGGNYDLTAQSLLIHRSTLRYRLGRIRDVGGLDLADVDTRLNVHVATRAWRVLGSD
jgi:sugar diacid utilization regulator